MTSYEFSEPNTLCYCFSISNNSFYRGYFEDFQRFLAHKVFFPLLAEHILQAAMLPWCAATETKENSAEDMQARC